MDTETSGPSNLQPSNRLAAQTASRAKVRGRDARTPGRLLRERFAGSGTIRSTRTTVVLETLRESGQIPVGALPPVPAAETAEKDEEVLL